ncbi:hypothetical protein BD410DRAFT_843521 [Rickenella mellea]|uniref:Uncharacterized protein n=1 Tax=Rickenella mellea TaxID=50990 RepID=A0A4Y7PSR1_9AGAM|nr:hypothetical protein BD410DRAFT_843521 [Rickenella mellea]
MAPTRTHQRRIHQYFPPLTVRTRFAVESPPFLPSLTLRTDFPKSEPNRDDPTSSTTTSDSENTRPLISKPSGEVTRHKRGGYGLKEELNWNEGLYKAVQKRVHELAKEHLYLHGTFPKQDKAKLEIVYAEAKKSFPVLNEYQGDWVVEDFLRVYLRNTKTRGKGAAAGGSR